MRMRLQMGITCAALLAGAAVDASPAGSAGPASSAVTKPKITYSFTGYANNVRDRPRYQLGKTNLRGSGTFAATLSGTHTTVQRPTYYPESQIDTTVLGYAYAAAAHGGKKKLTLTVEVVNSTSQKDCQTGTRGTITLVDDNKKRSNGQNRDSITTSFPTASCPTYVQGTSNADNPQTQPTKGGPPDGGQWARVTIKR